MHDYRTNVRHHFRRKPKGGYGEVVRHQRTVAGSGHGRREVREEIHRKVPLHGFAKSGDPFPKKDMKKVFTLPIRTAVLVPGTKQHHIPIGKREFRHRIEEARNFLRKENGGYTSWVAKGGFTGEDGRVIEEDIGEVVSYATLKDYLKNRPAVEHFLQVKAKEWGQESMGYEVKDKLYYVPSAKK